MSNLPAQLNEQRVGQALEFDVNMARLSGFRDAKRILDEAALWSADNNVRLKVIWYDDLINRYIRHVRIERSE